MMGVVVRVDFSAGGPRPGDVVADPNRLLSGAEIAALLGVKPATWRSLVRQGYAPAPDDPGGDGPLKGRRPRWRLSTVRRFKQSRPGAGFRSDLVK